jgi:GT2 family glycosyltransferase
LDTGGGRMTTYDIIMPCFNTPEEQIQKTIKNLQDKAYYNLNFIVVNKPQSVVANRLEGLSKTDADIIFMCDDDIEVITEHWDKKMLDALLSKDEIAVVGVNIVPHGPGNENRMSRGERIEYMNEIGGALFVYKRKDDEYNFDTIFEGSQYEDQDFCYQARHKGYKVLYLGTVKILHAFENKNVNRSNRMRFFQKWGQ